MKQCAWLLAIVLTFGGFVSSCSKEQTEDEAAAEEQLDEEGAAAATEEGDEDPSPGDDDSSTVIQQRGLPTDSATGEGPGEDSRVTHTGGGEGPTAQPIENNTAQTNANQPTSPSGSQEPTDSVGGGSAVALTIGDIGLTGNGAERTIEIFMVNGEPVAGFQFLLAGAAPTGSTGGTASAQGFQVSTSGGGGVIGFSFAGNTIPPGQGLLTRLSFVPQEGATQVCLTEPIIADPLGESLSVTPGGCVTLN